MTILQKILLLCIVLITATTYFYVNQKSSQKRAVAPILIPQIKILPKKEKIVQEKEPESKVFNYFKQAIEERKRTDSSNNAEDILAQLKKRIILNENNKQNIESKHLTRKHFSHPKTTKKEKLVYKKLKQEILQLLSVPKKKKSKQKSKTTQVKKKYIAKKHTVKKYPRRKQTMEIKKRQSYMVAKQQAENKLPFVKILGVVKESKEFEEKFQFNQEVNTPQSYTFSTPSKEETLSDLPFVQTLQVVKISQSYEATEEPSMY